jgi:hypothetical protein
MSEEVEHFASYTDGAMDSKLLNHPCAYQASLDEKVPAYDESSFVNCDAAINIKSKNEIIIERFYLPVFNLAIFFYKSVEEM